MFFSVLQRQFLKNLGHLGKREVVQGVGQFDHVESGGFGLRATWGRRSSAPGARSTSAASSSLLNKTRDRLQPPQRWARVKHQLAYAGASLRWCEASKPGTFSVALGMWLRELWASFWWQGSKTNPKRDQSSLNQNQLQANPNPPKVNPTPRPALMNKPPATPNCHPIRANRQPQGPK